MNKLEYGKVYTLTLFFHNKKQNTSCVYVGRNLNHSNKPVLRETIIYESPFTNEIILSRFNRYHLFENSLLKINDHRAVKELTGSEKEYAKGLLEKYLK